ncbi:MAG: hypothetical protein LBJ37_04590 [Paucimonas sp.]|jgi:hypothetical protein|nr:hypothetical protein [Paucimonas sp.]
MTTSFSGVRLGKAAVALLTFSISLVVHADQASTASTDKVTVGTCRDAWVKSSAAQTCFNLDFAVSGDVCTISVICAGPGGASDRQEIDAIYSLVPMLTNQNGTVTSGERISNP